MKPKEIDPLETILTLKDSIYYNLHSEYGPSTNYYHPWQQNPIPTYDYNAPCYYPWNPYFFQTNYSPTNESHPRWTPFSPTKKFPQRFPSFSQTKEYPQRFPSFSQTKEYPQRFPSFSPTLDPPFSSYSNYFAKFIPTNSVVKNTKEPTNCQIQEIKKNNFQAKRKFKCSYSDCNKSYVSKTNLKSHILTHKGERPYKCNWEGCGRCYTRLDELNRHMRIHTGDKRHACTQCDMRFVRKDHLNKHVSRKHVLKTNG
ncbi:hypothetical protein HZS_5414 [Henneguya salminicola]|nr:hypothetical protein HZS_5414 [Henneguya salminicola]